MVRARSGAGDILYDQKRSCSQAAQIPTEVQHDDERLAEKILSFMREFTNILLRAKRHREGRTGLELVDLLTDISLEINNLKRYIESHTNCNDILP